MKHKLLNLLFAFLLLSVLPLTATYSAALASPNIQHSTPSLGKAIEANSPDLSDSDLKSAATNGEMAGIHKVTSAFRQEDGYVHDVFAYSAETSKNSKLANTITEESEAATYNVNVYSRPTYKNYVEYLEVSIGNPLNSGIYTTKSKGRVKNVKVYWGFVDNSNQLNVMLGNRPFSIDNHKKKDTDLILECDTLIPSSSHFISEIQVEEDVRYISLFAVIGKYAHVDSIDIAWDVDEDEMTDLSYYTRNGVADGDLGTICLPYSISANQYHGCSIYEVAGYMTNAVSATGSSDAVAPSTIVLKQINNEAELAAGTPYIFQANGSYIDFGYTPIEASDATGTETSSAGHANGLYGTFTDYDFGNAATTDNIYILNRQGQFQKASNNSGVDAYHAYIKMNEVPLFNEKEAEMSNQHLLYLSSNGDEQPTSITSSYIYSNDLPIKYDILGRKNSQSSSIQIINGKKIIKTK